MLCQLGDKHAGTLAGCTSSSAAVRALPGLFSFFVAHFAPGQPAAIVSETSALQCGTEDCILFFLWVRGGVRAMYLMVLLAPHTRSHPPASRRTFSHNSAVLGKTDCLASTTASFISGMLYSGQLLWGFWILL